jgi:hypothetical protein
MTCLVPRPTTKLVPFTTRTWNETPEKQTHTMSASNFVHELDAATLRPFIESNNVVLLAILMLPQSETCEAFVPTFRSVSNSVTPHSELTRYGRSPGHHPKNRLLLAKSTSMVTGTQWHLLGSQAIRTSCCSMASMTTKRTMERSRKQGQLSCKARLFSSITNPEKYHLLRGPLFTISYHHSNKRYHTTLVQEQLQRRGGRVHKIHYCYPVRESSQRYAPGACVRRHRQCGACARRRCRGTCARGIQQFC